MNFKDFLTTFDSYLEYENLFSSHYYGYVNNVFVEKKLLYPILIYHTDAMNHSILDNSITVLKFNFFVFDKLKTDNSNVIDVQDDLLKKLVKIQSYLKRKFFATNFNITAISDEAYSEKITGWVMECKIRLDIGCITSLWNPSFANNLKLWLKADSGVVYDENNKVSQWHDVSGNGYVFNQSNPDKQPLYIPSIDSMNHKPAIKFDNNTLKCYQGMYIGTIFILANYDYNTFQNYDGLFTIIEYSETNAIFAVGTRGGTAFWPLNGFVGNNFYVNNNKTFDFAPLKIPKICYGFINSGIPTYWSNAMIGQDRSVSDRFWHGNIYEVIIYDRILSFTEIEKVKNYLKEKYAMDF